MKENTIKAPWTNEQVQNLNKWQQCEWIHPFTCGSPEESANCHRKDKSGNGTLLAITEDWQCPCGWYKQDWAHSYMATGEMKSV